MMNWWLANYVDWYGAHFAIAWVLWVIISITLHELAHGWVAIRCGDDVPIHSGHMTWNPLVHIPFPHAWIMFALFGFTWGLMPTNPANYNRRYDDARVAFAGPAMNALLAAACLAADAAWLTFARGVPEPMQAIIHTILWTGMVINLTGFLFNLVPVPPLDGSHIASDLIPAYRRMLGSEGGQMGGMIALAALFFFGSKYIWMFVFSGTDFAIKRATMLLGGEYRPPF